MWQLIEGSCRQILNLGWKCTQSFLVLVPIQILQDLCNSLHWFCGVCSGCVWKYVLWLKRLQDNCVLSNSFLNWGLHFTLCGIVSYLAMEAPLALPYHLLDITSLLPYFQFCSFWVDSANMNEERTGYAEDNAVDFNHKQGKNGFRVITIIIINYIPDLGE